MSTLGWDLLLKICNHQTPMTTYSGKITGRFLQPVLVCLKWLVYAEPAVLTLEQVCMQLLSWTITNRYLSTITTRTVVHDCLLYAPHRMKALFHFLASFFSFAFSLRLENAIDPGKLYK